MCDTRGSKNNRIGSANEPSPVVRDLLRALQSVLTERRIMESRRLGVHPLLLVAYRAANYAVFGPDGREFVLRIATVSRELVRHMLAAGNSSAAYLTAFNPYSEPRARDENLASQMELEEELSSLNLMMLRGEGRDASGEWPPEPSVLALGISCHDADRLARQFQQNAYVWVASASGLASLRLMQPLLIPDSAELAAWRAGLSAAEATAAERKLPREQALLMSAPADQLAHWLFPETRDLANPWPLTLPDGGTMGAGSEMDRMFRLVAAGLTTQVRDFAGA